jgi:hypothetical protein
MGSAFKFTMVGDTAESMFPFIMWLLGQKRTRDVASTAKMTEKTSGMSLVLMASPPFTF